MAGFGIVIGFIMSFFILLVVFSTSFSLLQVQVAEQEKILENTRESSFYSRLNENFEIRDPYFASGKIFFEITNLDNEDLYFVENDLECFSVFDNGSFVSTDNFEIKLKDKSPEASYELIEGGQSAVLIVESEVEPIGDRTYKIISCGGIVNEFEYDVDEGDTFNGTWKNRKLIEIVNPSNFSIGEYQIPLIINSSTSDFSIIDPGDIRFFIPLKENYIVDLPFDNSNELQNSYGRFYNNNFTLGNNLSINNNPSFTEDGSIFGALDFDGLDDFVYLNSTEVYDFDHEFTFSSWINWNKGGGGDERIFSSQSGFFRSLMVWVNDTASDDHVVFEVGFSDLPTSNFTTFNFNFTGSEDKWSFVTVTYDGFTMRYYLDGNLMNETYVAKNLDFVTNYSYVGSEVVITGGVPITSNNFNGSLDEVKLMDVKINSSEVMSLYENSLRFRELNHYNVEWDEVEEESLTYVKIPSVTAKRNVTIQMYYDYDGVINSSSNMESTFEYNIPRIVGYMTSNLITALEGIEIFSLYDNNSVIIGDDYFNLSNYESPLISAGNSEINDSVKVMKLTQVESTGNEGNVMVPISFAGQEFYYGNLRNSQDTFCVVSPFGDAEVEPNIAGTVQPNLTVTQGTGTCFLNATATASSFGLTSSIPVLVDYYGDNSDDDEFPFYPATTEDLYGVPSNNLDIGAGPLGAQVVKFDSTGNKAFTTIAAFGRNADGGNGIDGTSPGFKLVTNNPIGAIQQNDGDGAESTVMLPAKEFGMIFGSGENTEHIAIVTKYPNTNCSTYELNDVFIESTIISNGANGIYNHTFDPTDTRYMDNRWKLICDKPVLAYHERDTGNAETNLLGHLQMRQYVYPEPIYTIN